MQTENQYIQDLILKYLSGDLNPTEQADLKSWLELPSNREQFDRLTDNNVLAENLSHFDEVDIEKDWEKLAKNTINKSKSRSLSWLKYAAVLVPVIGLSVFVFLFSINNLDKGIAKEQDLNIRIMPTEAILCLDDGSIHNIINKDTSMHLNQATIAINSNSLNYKKKKTTTKKLKYNTINIPKGMQYQLVLSDGTKVWLNADTRFRYPEAFLSDKREVFIEKGEAFFEVEEDKKKPFYVNFNNHKLKVTGTKFNIRHYEECSVTLAEGSVVIDEKESAIKLKPNEQVKFSSQTHEKSIVKASIYYAWKDHVFKYRNARLETIMNDLSRFYDIHVFYANQAAKEKLFSLKLDRKNSFEMIADIINTTKQVKIKIIDKNIIIE